MDARGRVRVVSPSVERVLGHRIEALMGHRFLGKVHPEDRPFVRAQARRLVEGEPITGLEARLLHATGSWVPMRWSVSAGLNGTLYAVGHDRTDEERHRDARLRIEVTELRLRTAMELHDGILQTLTGAGLQIAVARKLAQTDPAGAERVLADLGSSLAAEQQEMRLYVDEMKGQPLAWEDPHLRPAERIAALLDRVALIWGLTTSLDADLRADIAPEALRKVMRIIQESTVNAARHGAACSVSVTVADEGSDIFIRVTDDGRGFSFLGTYDHAALKEKRLGPLSLKHRVEDAGGSISIDSTSAGATVSVRIPLDGEAVA